MEEQKLLEVFQSEIEGMTNREVSERTGLSLTYVSRLRNGNRRGLGFVAQVGMERLSTTMAEAVKIYRQRAGKRTGQPVVSKQGKQ